MILTEEQEQFRLAVREFADRELRAGYLPRARSLQFPHHEYGKMAQAGLLGLGFPAECGGQGADHVTVGIAAEELAYADFNCAYFALAAAGNPAAPPDDAMQEWAAGVPTGDVISAFGLTEPQAGSDARGIRTTATRDGDGWRLTGEKTSISLAGAAHIMTTLANIVEDGRPEGTSAFVVPLDSPGVTRRLFDDLGFRPVGRGAIHLQDVFVPDRYRVKSAGRSLAATLNVFDFSRPALGLMAIGAARAGLDEACAYAKERKAFGRAIGVNQGVSFPLAEHATRLEAARLLCYHTLELRDRGLRHTKEAAMCKWWAPFVATAALKDCLLTFGNYGYDYELPIGQRMLDVMALEIGDGTAQIQKLIIARDLVGRLD